VTTTPCASTLDLPDTWADDAGVLHSRWLLETRAGAARQLAAHREAA